MRPPPGGDELERRVHELVIKLAIFQFYSPPYPRYVQGVFLVPNWAKDRELRGATIADLLAQFQGFFLGRWI